MTDAADEQARQEAEARRLRIIQEADERLGLVTGETPKTDNDDDGDTAAAAPKVSGAARLAAMRKRRFKKGPTAAAKKDDGDGEEEASEKPSESVVEGATVAESKEPAVEAEPVVADVDTCPAPQVVEDEKDVCDANDDNLTQAHNKNQKKYMGVARMRRQKLKERHDADHDAGGITANQTTSLETILSADKVAAVLQRKKKKVALIPILMHFATTLLLFLAGFDVGWQQNQVLMANVHTELAPRELGLKIMQRKSNKLLDKFSSLSGRSLKDTGALAAEDEADDLKATSEEPKEANIDPLFRVDLDKLTEDDTLVNMLARVAIFLHRSLLKIILFPKTFTSSLISGFAQLLTIPPLLCVVALFIRQFVGKIVLGAKLPDTKPPDESEGKDVLSMGKNFIMGFITRAFPKVVTIYDAWSHLRTDMFVVLCGLIVGFTAQYQLYALPLSVRMGMEEIAVVHAPVEPSPMDTATMTGDEL